MSIFTKQYFIAKFEAIPEERWATGDFLDEENRMCAFGHCGVSLEADTKEGHAMDILFRKGFHTEPSSIASEINDGEDARYPKPTPKQRILAALRRPAMTHPTHHAEAERGPAFPYFKNGLPVAGGLSLRDYFAARAPAPTKEELAFESERDRTRNPHNESHKPDRRSQLTIECQLRYKWADAMLTARSVSAPAKE